MLINGDSIPLTVVHLLFTFTMFVVAAICCARLRSPTTITINAFGVFITDCPFQSLVVGVVPSGMEAQHHWSVKEQPSLCCAPVRKC